MEEWILLSAGLLSLNQPIKSSFHNQTGYSFTGYQFVASSYIAVPSYSEFKNIVYII